MEILVILAAIVGLNKINATTFHPDAVDFIREYALRQGFQRVHLLEPLEDSEDFLKSLRQTSWRKWLLQFFRGFISYPVTYSSHNYCQVKGNSSVSSKPESWECDQRSLELLRNSSSSSPLFVEWLLTGNDFELLQRVFHSEEHRKSNWLILTSDVMISATPEFHLPLDNKAVFAIVTDIGDSKSIQVDLWDIYKAAPYLSPKKFYLGRWSAKKWRPSTNGLQGRLQQKSPPDSDHSRREERERMEDDQLPHMFPLFSREPWERRKDLSGLVLRCTTKEDKPYVGIGKKNEDGTLEDLYGMYGDFFLSLQQALNFTYRCFENGDDTWGRLHEGRWLGMVGDLVEDRADIIVSNIDLTYARGQVIDFPHGLQYDSCVLLIKRVLAVDDMSNKYTKNFTWPVWLLVATFAIILSLSMVFVFRHSPYSEEKPLSEVLWLIVAAFCNAGETVFAVSISSRLLVLVLYLTTMMLHAYYNSFLISSLTVEKTYLPFTDLQGLYEAKTYSFGIGYGSSKEDYLKMSPFTLHESIWNEMVMADPLNLSPSVNDLMERVCTKKHATLISRISLKAQPWPCSVSLLPGTYYPHQSTMPLRKDSPLTSVFQFQMRKLIEGGIMSRLQRKWTPITVESPDPDKTPISILQASTAFCLTLVGHLAALAILAMEIIFAKWQRTKQRA